MTVITQASPARLGGLLTVLMLGNIVIGSGVLAPAGMMNSLVAAFDRPPQEIGRLIAYGAVVLFIGAPTLAYATNKIGRRTLLAGCLAVYAIGHFASAAAPSFDALLLIRLAMIAAAAVFTPQAASALALLVSPERRAPAVTYVFLGWSIAAALGMPLLSLAAATIGWREAYAALGLAAALAGVGVYLTMPANLYSEPLPFSAWKRVLSHPAILAILAVTGLQLVGQFVVFPYLAAEIKRVTGAPAGEIALLLAFYGAAGLVGALVSTQLVGRVGPGNGVVACVTLILLGLILWGLIARDVASAAAAIFVWGLGFAAGNSMQQARLIAAEPQLASASVALNSSVLYGGQAIGASIGGALLAGGQASALSWTGAAIVALALVLSIFVTRVMKV